MSPLRERMIREMQLQRKSLNTINAYVAAVADLARHYDRSPERIGYDEVRAYLHYLIVDRKLADSTCNLKLAGIRFLYRHVLGQPEFNLRIPRKRAGKLPEPLSRKEIQRLFAASKNKKHRVMLMTAYGAGLRVSELVQLLTAVEKCGAWRRKSAALGLKKHEGLVVKLGRLLFGCP